MRKIHKSKIKKKSRKNPLKSITIADFFNIQTPDKYPINPPDCYTLGKFLGMIKATENCGNESFNEDVKTYAGLTIRSLANRTLKVNNSSIDTKTTEGSFNLGIIFGLNEGIYKYCTLPRPTRWLVKKTLVNKLKEFVIEKNISLQFKTPDLKVTTYE